MHSPPLLLARELDRPDRAVIATDAEGCVIFWNAGAEALYGWVSNRRPSGAACST